MQWRAPSEKDSATTTLEKRLWDAADQFRANSGLKPQEYSGPILGPRRLKAKSSQGSSTAGPMPVRWCKVCKRL